MEPGFKQSEVMIVAQLPWQDRALGGQSPPTSRPARSPGLLLKTISLPISSCRFHIHHSPPPPALLGSSDAIFSLLSTLCFLRLLLHMCVFVCMLYCHQVAHEHVQAPPSARAHKPTQSPYTWRRQKWHIVFSWILEVAECQSAHCNIWVFAAARGARRAQTGEKHSSEAGSCEYGSALVFFTPKTGCPWHRLKVACAALERKKRVSVNVTHFGVQNESGCQNIFPCWGYCRTTRNLQDNWELKNQSSRAIQMEQLDTKQM